MKGYRILIVDDDNVALNALSTKLAGEGFIVMTADDGGAALASMREANPDLILTNMSFARDVGHGGGVPWDGILLMNWIHRTTPDVPVIIIAESGDPEVRKRAIAAGAAGFFQKPVNSDEMLDTIRQALIAPRQTAAG
jgi:CheY-like chemotaxis protein